MRCISFIRRKEAIKLYDTGGVYLATVKLSLSHQVPRESSATCFFCLYKLLRVEVLRRAAFVAKLRTYSW